MNSSVSPPIARVQARVFRYPIATPVTTSFGIMRDRPAVFVRVEDTEGAHGWGEIWCNFPEVGAEHRARLVASVFAPLLIGRSFNSPTAAFAELSDKTGVLAIQCAEPGPIAQCIAGIDVALWDLYARRRNAPLWRVLRGEASPAPGQPEPAADGLGARIAVYASGLNPESPEKLAAVQYAHGHRAFKLKIGFGETRDVANLRALRETLGDAPIMVDANQAWDQTSALHMACAIAPFEPGWLEEPLRADRPWHEWTALRDAIAIPLAAGENIASTAGFDAAIKSTALGVVQPDLAKWGGFSGCLPVAREVIESGARFCPHYLGGGIGLLASAHLLAACGGDGMLEIDANDNPLRMLLCGPVANVSAGTITLSDAPGLGVEPDFSAVAAHEVFVNA